MDTDNIDIIIPVEKREPTSSFSIVFPNGIMIWLPVNDVGLIAE